MKKVTVALSLLFVLCLGLAASAATPIKIGYLAALTGDYAAYGTTEVNMAKLVVGDINAKGGLLGRKIELVVYDTKTRNEVAVNAVRRMIKSDKVCAIIGANSSGINIATAPIVHKGKTPQISTVGTNPLVTVDYKGKVRPYSFRVCFTDPYQGALAADLAKVELKKNSAAILYNVGSDYAQGLREFFTKSYKDLGGKIVADEGYRDTDVDFRAQLTKVKSSGAEVLFLPGMGKDMALIIKQARELGLNIAIIGGDGYGEFMNEIAGKAMKGTYWINHTYLSDPGMAPIFKRYKEVYKDDCKEFVNGTMAYDATQWLLNAIERANSTDGTAIAKALETTKNLKLAHATLSISAEDHNPINKAGIILKVDDNLKMQFYKKVQPK
jgi:branched-chain amino acid transport system substrate-binding protein